MGGEIIGFINSDDCLTDGAAAIVLERFAANPDIDLVYGEAEWIGANSESQGFHRGEISSLSEVLDIYNVWLKSRQYVQPEVFWRRSLWDRVGRLNDSYDLAFDFEYWVRCFQAGAKVKKIPRTLARFRRLSNQKSTAGDKASREIRAIVSHALESPNSLGPLRRAILQNRLSFDAYHLSDRADTTESMWKSIAKHPGWLMLQVRKRLASSRAWKTIFP